MAWLKDRKGDYARWAGGRIYQGPRGVVYVIERTIAGQGYVKRLRMSEAHALAELALFDRDPLAYVSRKEQAARPAVSAGAFLDTNSVREFLAHKAKKEGLSETHLADLRRYLANWAKVLAGRDLRSVETKELKAALRAWDGADRHRTIAIKSFCTYLREEIGSLPAAQDPTFTLMVPKPPQVAARLTKVRGYTTQEIERLYRNLGSQAIRDVLCVMAKTGMHLSECRRIARGQAEITPVEHEIIAGVVRFPHKRKALHPQSIDQQTLEAIKRLQKRESAPTKNSIYEAVERIYNRMAKIDQTWDPKTRVRFGYLRRFFTTWSGHPSTEKVTYDKGPGGLTRAEIAQIIGHTSPGTTAIYDETEVPMFSKIKLNLVHPKDPKPIEAQRKGRAEISRSTEAK